MGPKCQLFLAIQLLVLLFLQSNVICYQFKVGNMNAWGIPTSANPSVYTNWAKKYHPKIGDSLLFLYPPSEDSVIQVTEQSFRSCNLKDPILYMNDGNSLFNITSEGRYFFTSGEPGHCEKKQKLAVSVLFANGSALPPSYASEGSVADSSAPSYPTVFGAVPLKSMSSPIATFPSKISAAIGVIIFAAINYSM
ncbi:hypothetical protein MKW94_006555 [Papaver nudicaule]|uniref:Phytocyanin domain-containing protein n=1 Tax=Papaver nudicaule TaxID=74823 RepID=A0AA41S146_PAPNU|nr:hypothetical protein [Papaver nudicaule]